MDQSALKTELLQLGYEEGLIKQALAQTQDKEKAVELIKSLMGSDPSKTELPSNQRQQSKNMALKVQGMDYPMGDDRNEVLYKMVFLVRMDLKMGTGKIAAQTGHAVLGAYQQLEQRFDEDPAVEVLLENWEECGCPKIVLKVESKEELLELEKKSVEKGLNTYVVCDAGKTQVEPGSITVCAIGPAKADAIDSITGHLKLLH